MKVLIVGAGAVGQVFGRHVQLGGGEVALLVRPAHARRVARGMTLYALNQPARARWTPRPFTASAVLTAPAQVPALAPDCVLLCVSSTALRRGSWLTELAAAAPEATVVTLQPGLEDRACIVERLAARGSSAGAAGRRLVTGLIGFMSYAAPLPGEAVEAPGTAYWLPPLTDLPLSGPRGRRQPVIELLRRGGLPARRHADVGARLAFTGPVLQMQIVALECAGWRFAALQRQGRLRRLAFEATREAIRIAERHLGQRSPLGLRLLRPSIIGAGLGLTRRLAPFELERFLEVHFTKVADQTRHELASLQELAVRHGLSATAITSLARRLAQPSTTHN
jgi:2-dehydropantoate 2-reductase